MFGSGVQQDSDYIQKMDINHMAIQESLEEDVPHPLTNVVGLHEDILVTKTTSLNTWVLGLYYKKEGTLKLRALSYPRQRPYYYRIISNGTAEITGENMYGIRNLWMH